jgi:hypothetical protein
MAPSSPPHQATTSVGWTAALEGPLPALPLEAGAPQAPPPRHNGPSLLVYTRKRT